MISFTELRTCESQLSAGKKHICRWRHYRCVDRIGYHVLVLFCFVDYFFADRRFDMRTRNILFQNN